MAIKKSELYSSLWSGCDELRGGMDASQYKDYVLVLLFIKYVSDKYAGQPYAPITIPKGAGFKDMVALKGKPDIGDQINKKIIAPLVNANKLSDFPDFNDASKLGTGKEMVDRLINLIAIFENPALDFSKNRAEGDDILGDAYEYLMRHFATESGKSKGQFYTPAEVSRIIAQVIGIRGAATSAATSVYDPTCGSGSLLLKVGDEASTAVTLYGQEKDAATSGLARMNMILHDNPTALIVQGNTLADPKFKDGDSLKTFDHVVANPPFSDKRWSNGIDPLRDPYDRLQPFGTPLAKQGDYAYLLHPRAVSGRGAGRLAMMPEVREVWLAVEPVDKRACWPLPSLTKWIRRPGSRTHWTNFRLGPTVVSTSCCRYAHCVNESGPQCPGGADSPLRRTQVRGAIDFFAVRQRYPEIRRRQSHNCQVSQLKRAGEDFLRSPVRADDFCRVIFKLQREMGRVRLVYRRCL